MYPSKTVPRPILQALRSRPGHCHQVDVSSGPARPCSGDGPTLHDLHLEAPDLALDMCEYAYHIDFGANAKAYVDTFMRNLDGKALEARYEDASRSSHSAPGSNLNSATFGRRHRVGSDGGVLRLRLSRRKPDRGRNAGFDASSMKGGHCAWKAIGGPTRMHS